MDEKRLWAAVLIQAIRDLVGYTYKHERTSVQYFARLRFADDNREVGSFLWVCDELELEPSWIRRRMVAQIHSDQVGKEGAGWCSVSRLQRMFSKTDQYTVDCVADLLSA